MIHQIKETAITIIPGLGGALAALEATNVLIKIVVGTLTGVYILIRIGIAWKEFKSKK